MLYRRGCCGGPARGCPQPDRTAGPPVDVIVPAYNEEDNIARLLRSIDVAAARYGGPVRVVVSNDGSSDRTEQIARTVRSRPSAMLAAAS